MAAVRTLMIDPTRVTCTSFNSSSYDSLAGQAMKICGVFPHTDGQARYQIASCRSCEMMAWVFSCVTITCTGSTGCSFFSPQIARPTRPPRMRASNAMTTYFMDSKIPEFLLQQCQSTHRSRFCSQNPWPQPDRRKSPPQSRLLLSLRESTLRSNQHRGASSGRRNIANPQLRARRQQQCGVARCALLEQIIQADGICDLGHMVAPTLLASRNSNPTPVLHLLGGLLLIQLHHTPLREHRRNPRHTELGRLLHDPVHPLAA